MGKVTVGSILVVQNEGNMNNNEETKNIPRKRELKSLDELKAIKEKDTKKKKVIGIIIAIIVIIAIVIFSLSWTKGFRTIKLLELFNKVSFDRGTQVNVDAYDGMSLKAGDTIRTGDEESFARLVLDDDKYIYIEENSEVNFEMAGRKNTSKTTLHLNYGAIFNELDGKLTDKQSFEVKSPNSLMAVRGTKFRVSTYVGPEDILYTRISVLEGQVQCWLIYPDGTISEESHMAEVGSEVLIYYDEENGITDFAKSNEISGAYYAKKPGEFISPIRYMQLPKQLIKFLVQRSQNEGVKFEAISLDELIELADMETEYDEPVIERYREEIAEYIAKHPEEFANKDNDNNDVALNSENNGSDTSGPSDGNTPDGTDEVDSDTNAADEATNNDEDFNTDNNTVDNGNENNNVGNVDRAKATPTPTPSMADLIEQYYKEILAHPDVYAHLLPTPTPAPVVEVAQAEEEPEVVPEYVPEAPKNDNNSGNKGNNDSGASSGSSGGGTPPTGGGSSGDGNTAGSTYGSSDLDDNSKVPKYRSGGDTVYIGYTKNTDGPSVTYTKNANADMEQAVYNASEPALAADGGYVEKIIDSSTGKLTAYRIYNPDGAGGYSWTDRNVDYGSNTINDSDGFTVATWDSSTEQWIVS